MLLAAKVIIKTLIGLMLCVDASLLLVVTAPGAAGPLFRGIRIGRLWSSKYDGCSLRDVIQEEKAGMAALAAEQSRGVYEIAGHGVRRGDVVLDCGAGVGVYTRHALDLGARLVVAVEPAPEKGPLLSRNLAAEIAAGKVIVVPKGLWFQDGELSYYVEETSRPGRGRHVTAPLTTIDHLVGDLHLERVDFIRIDAGGAERQALNGAYDTVKRFHPRMAVALRHLEHDAEEIPRLIRTLWPQMRTICGPCVMEAPGGMIRIQPQVVAAY